MSLYFLLSAMFQIQKFLKHNLFLDINVSANDKNSVLISLLSDTLGSA